MRVVLDTNVLMSGIFFSGPPAMILAAWSEGRLDLLALRAARFPAAECASATYST